ncbi:MAG: Dyp-type peroxidase [Thermomicrobiales bacterium]
MGTNREQQPQPVLNPLSASAIFLVMTIRPGDDAAAMVRDLLADLGDLQKAVGFRNVHAQLSCVAGIGSDAWDRLFGDPRPARLHPFRAIAGARHHAPATSGDLLFHIRAQKFDLCFELSALVTGRLAGAADVVDEVHGFRYFDARDLLGFVDGTANPVGEDAVEVAIIADDPLFQGGSYVIVQKYLHDIDRWRGFSVEEQERIIGRTKLDNVELPDDLPSHVTLNTIVDENGVEHDILRDNMPFGQVGTREFGTYYIGYAADPAITEQMLQRMFVGDPPGTYDRILDVSTPVTGCLFFVPSADFLDDPSIVRTRTTAATSGQSAPSDGSLAIGSLKGSPRS